MATEQHSHYTLLHEDGDTRILMEFKEIVADRVIQHFIDFLKGVGYMESSVFEVMQQLSTEYFESLNTLEPLNFSQSQEVE
jgi:peptide deformylase